MRSRRENFHSIYIFLFFVITFFVLETRDPEKYELLFSFRPADFLAGEWWRAITYQFIEGGMLSLFFDLLILYIMGGAVEEELGTGNLLALFAIATLGSAAVATLLGVTLLGSFFSSFTLLFVYATLAPEQTFLIFFILPVKVKWLAWLDLAWLLVFTVIGRGAGVSALVGTALAYGYFILISGTRFRLPRKAVAVSFNQKPPLAAAAVSSGEKNLQRFATMKETLASGSEESVSALLSEIERDIVPGVNICPPADYKPEHDDRYCVRCEGFAECSVRYMRARKKA